MLRIGLRNPLQVLLNTASLAFRTFKIEKTKG